MYMFLILIIYLAQILPPRSNPCADDFAALDNSLKELGLCDELRCKIYHHLGAILHLGNVCFENNVEGYAEVSGDTSAQCIEWAANLLNIDSNQLKRSLLKRKYKLANRAYNEDILYVYIQCIDSFALYF